MLCLPFPNPNQVQCYAYHFPILTRFYVTAYRLPILTSFYVTAYRQQDAQEFLRYLLEGLHEDVNRVTSKPKHQQIDDDKFTT